MKKLLLTTFISFLVSASIFAQKRVLGPAEQKMNAALCDCISKLDLSKINNAQEANAAFMNCFSEQASLLVEVAEERNIDFTDDVAMNKLGEDLGKNLLTLNCKGFMQLAVKMASDKTEHETETQTTNGTFKRIDNKGFNYIVVTDDMAAKNLFYGYDSLTVLKNSLIPQPH